LMMLVPLGLPTVDGWIGVVWSTQYVTLLVLVGSRKVNAKAATGPLTGSVPSTALVTAAELPVPLLNVTCTVLALFEIVPLTVSFKVSVPPGVGMACVTNNWKLAVPLSLGPAEGPVTVKVPKLA